MVSQGWVAAVWVGIAEVEQEWTWGSSGMLLRQEPAATAEREREARE